MRIKNQNKCLFLKLLLFKQPRKQVYFFKHIVVKLIGLLTNKLVFVKWNYVVDYIILRNWVVIDINSSL